MDFTGLYAEPAEAAIDADLDWAGKAAKDFATRYEGKLAELTGDGLAEAIKTYEALGERLGRVMSYVGLRYQQNVTDQARAKAYGDAQTRVTDIEAPIVFFTLELNQLDDASLVAKRAESEALRRYDPWIDRLRTMRPHQLSDELEKFLHDTSVVGATAWNRLFDETMSSLAFPVEIDGEVQSLALEPTLTLLLNADRTKREAASKALSAVFAENIRLFTLITNTLAKEKEIEDRWRKLPSPQSSRHLANQVEPEVVQALRDAVVAAYPRLSHRYYAMKAKWLGLDHLESWDRNAPLPTPTTASCPGTKRAIRCSPPMATLRPKWRRRRATFSTRVGSMLWSVKAKPPGAFAHPTVVSAHPFVMLNYLGKTRDVMTLAHELGHGVHQILAAAQGELLSRTPLTLAETASVFGEMLTFKRVLGATTDPAVRKALLASKVEDMINTVVRQIAFYEFESRVHLARREGELTSERLGEIWMAVQGESLGPAVRLGEGYENYWAYIPHFIHSPFYVYAYAFGDGLVNALYAVYEKGEVEDFQSKYFEMLRAGGTLKHKSCWRHSASTLPIPRSGALALA